MECKIEHPLLVLDGAIELLKDEIPDDCACSDKLVYILEAIRRSYANGLGGQLDVFADIARKANLLNDLTNNSTENLVSKN